MTAGMQVGAGLSLSNFHRSAPSSQLLEEASSNSGSWFIWLGSKMAFGQSLLWEDQVLCTHH